MKIITKYLSYLYLFIAGIAIVSCSDNEEVRMPADIIGIWKNPDNSFIQFREDNVATQFLIEYQDGQSIGKWDWDNVYYYEPGYNIVIYLDSEYEANVYQITELNHSTLQWCWVDKIKPKDAESIGTIIGDIINKAQEGYELNPDFYQTFTRITEDEFLEILESLDVIYEPWDY